MLRCPMPMRSTCFAALAVAVVYAALVSAAMPVFWVVATQADFLKGEVENLSIDSDGRVVLGPAIEKVAEPGSPVLWTIVSGPAGASSVASGHDGRVYRVAANGQTTVVFDAEELEVHALAAAPDGGLYAATSPDGKVYRVAADGTSAIFFDPEDKYIWSLAVDGEGTVYAGTGEKGVIYQISRTGQGKPFYTTKSTNVVALAFDREGRLLAGTDSPGRVFRIDRNGKGFVLLESPFKEIHALRLDDTGVIYAGAVGAKAESERPSQPPTTEPARSIPVPSVSAEISGITIIDTGAAQREAGPARREGGGQGRGAVYRIMPDGLWDVRWESADDTPYDLAFDATGALIVGTGGAGRIFRVSGEPATVTLIGRAEAQQVTRFLQQPDGRLTFVTANPGKVFRLTSDRAPRGVYLSEVRDAQTIASWGAVRWRANGGGRVEMFTRSGNTATPDETWSDWAGPYADANGEQIRSPKARYLQWRAVLSETGKPGDDPPVLTSVTAAFLPRNTRPVVGNITVHPPGTVFQRPFPTSDQMEIAGFDATPVDGRPGQPPAAQPGASGSPAPPLGRRLYQKGLQTFVWNARDDNDDTLQYDVLYRREGETAWKVLKRGLWDPIVVWDTTSVPDGSYTIKVVAADAPTNAPPTALTGEAESSAFDIDNTSPQIQITTPRRSGGPATLTFVVRDDHSPVKRVEYSLDADRWRMIYPKDGIPDSRVEEFELALEGDAAQKGVIIRATDAMNNVATAAVGR